MANAIVSPSSFTKKLTLDGRVLLESEETFAVTDPAVAVDNVFDIGLTVEFSVVCARPQFGRNITMTKRKIKANFFFILLTCN